MTAERLPEFDVDGLRSASEMTFPAGDTKKQMQMYVANAQDLCAAADYIEELWVRLGMPGGVPS